MVTKLPQSEGNILGYEVPDTVTEEDYQLILNDVRSAIEQYGSVRLLARVPENVSAKFGTIDDGLQFLSDHRDDVERYAIVGDDRLTEWTSTFADTVTEIDVRHFNLADEAEAWEWLR